MDNPLTSDDSGHPAGKLLVSRASADIWVVPIRPRRELVDELKPTLSPDEIARALRFRAEDHRDFFIVGRAILRELLSCYMPDSPESLVFRYGSKGKPYLRDHPSLQFNLAHSGGRAVYAVGGDELGVDIELIKPLTDWRKISVRFFSAREVEELERLDPARQVSGFFSCWTRKEAYVKATGEGLATPLGRFYAGAQPSQQDGAIDEEDRPLEWYFKTLDLGDEHAGAIVTRFNQCRIQLFTFSRIEECLRSIREKNLQA
jgi:4'-phosphopantetheinyl transferase